MEISISIVTFNNAIDIKELLDSLESSGTTKLLSQLFIVDNDSKDTTLEIVEEFKKKIPTLQLIKNSKNHGFGSAHNQAILASSSNYHVICNPDVKFKDSSLRNLIELFEAFPQIGLLAPKVVYPDGKLQPLNRRYPSLIDLAVQRMGNLFPSSIRESRSIRYLMKDCDYSEELDVPCLSGCFIVGRTTLLQALGGFDPNYFLYFEDFDLCQKVQKANFRTVYSPALEIEHRWARNSHKRWIHTWYFISSAFRFFNKWGWKLY